MDDFQFFITCKRTNNANNATEVIKATSINIMGVTVLPSLCPN